MDPWCHSNLFSAALTPLALTTRVSSRRGNIDKSRWYICFWKDINFIGTCALCNSICFRNNKMLIIFAIYTCRIMLKPVKLHRVLNSDYRSFKVSLKFFKVSEFIVLSFFAADYCVINNTRNIHVHVKGRKEGTISGNEFSRRKEREIYSQRPVLGLKLAQRWPISRAIMRVRAHVHRNSRWKFFQWRSLSCLPPSLGIHLAHVT